MIRTFLLSLCVIFVFATVSVAQVNSIIEVSGVVIDQERKQPLQDVNVQVKGTVTGAITSYRQFCEVRK